MNISRSSDLILKSASTRLSPVQPTSQGYEKGKKKDMKMFNQNWVAASLHQVHPTHHKVGQVIRPPKKTLTGAMNDTLGNVPNLPKQTI